MVGDKSNMNYALLFAGGKGTRMYTSVIPKQFIEVDGKPIIIRSIECFEKNSNIDGISVVCIEDWCEYLQKQVEKYQIKKVKWIVPGAKTGQQSIYNGLNAIVSESNNPGNDIVLISDGVRPFVKNNVIDECIECVRQNGSCVVLCPVPETIVEIDKKGEIVQIPDRSKWFLSKAPQGFYLDEILKAHHKAMMENRFDCTNSAELMKRYGHSLYSIQDSPENIKVTTPIDIAVMETVINQMK